MLETPEGDGAGAPAAAAAEPAPAPKARRLPPSEWEHWDDERLLDVRLCDLDIAIEGGPLEERIAQLRRELEGAGLQLRPHFWLSDEWFTPDGVPGVAVPFYMAHPRLARLELNQMLEVEGGSAEWCMRILRHEAGHVLENAYRLKRRPRRVKTFGPTHLPYPESYSPRPYSRSFVQHLEAWYAQSHPDEDFAETFAVWLTPGSGWRERYLGWPALRKLEYMDELLAELRGKPPAVANRRRVDPLSGLRRTLRSHYKRRRALHAPEDPRVYDRDLRRLFAETGHGQPAAAFLARHRRELRRLVQRFTGERVYAIDQVLRGMVARCRELGLRLPGSEEQARLEFALLLTVQTMSALRGGRHRFVL